MCLNVFHWKNQQAVKSNLNAVLAVVQYDLEARPLTSVTLNWLKVLYPEYGHKTHLKLNEITFSGSLFL